MESKCLSVSVIVPVCNRASLIGESLKSLLDQTVPVKEIIVVDDGSTDQTEKVVRSFGDSVRYIYQENAGPAAARNHGMRIAAGDLIAFQDSDDIWVDYKNELQLECLAKNPDVEFIFGDMANFRSGDDVLIAEIKNMGIHDYLVKEGSNLGQLFECLILENIIPTPTVLMKRSVVKRVGYFDESLRLAEDFEFWLRIAATCRAAFVPDVLLRRRLHGENLIANWTNRNLAMISVLESTGMRLADERVGVSDSVVSKIQEIRYDVGSRFLREGEFGRALEVFGASPPQRDKALRWRVKRMIAKALNLWSREIA